ncbi:phage holin family protein [Brackiella oedipodis]|uniref:phage holin family protein n=1 Tax=Brackiella oedipodis TaxID=124225 RepID=UPI00048C1484|nr:phage holin family protein [Brackiella oedipodis]
MLNLIITWVLNAVALLIVGYIFPGISVDSFGAALLAAVVLGLVNTLIKPILQILTLPITIVTLGLFLFVINALMFLFVGKLLGGFHVSGFWTALFGSIVYSIVSGFLSSLLIRANDK